MSVNGANDPLISVVIPTYQRAPLLERSLQSLTTQTLARSRFEVVVVDDGSSDWTRSVCERLRDQLALRYLRIENSGISAAKNLGLFSSQAPLVLFSDDDDVADPGLLATHVDAHGAHPQENIAVLGYTSWSSELEVSPLMTYVTEIGQLLFAYNTIDDRQLLDYRYFWGGRSSCKRSFLAQHGSFDQDMSGIEDIELGFRLAKHGLEVLHVRSARSYMLRAVTFDEFAKRCHKRGHALWRFNARHPDPAVERYCRVAESREKWPSLAPSLEAKMERIRELERRDSERGALNDSETAELRDLYGWTFEALQARGIAEAAAGACEPVHASIAIGAARVPRICREPVFIIGSPRSGTSILAWTLAQHSELFTENESDIFYYMLKDGHLERAFEISVARPDGTWLANHGVELRQFLAHLGLGLNALFTATSSGLRWVDQTPSNTLVVERLAEMFPDARFIHLLRDGRRVVHSMINFHRALGDQEAVERMQKAGRLPPWATDFRDSCQTWARLVGIASDFCERHPDRSLTVTNERLITEPGEAVRAVLEFLGVPYEAAPAQFLRTHRINSSFAGSGRSEHAPPTLSEPWREWAPERRSVFYEEAADTMVAKGLASHAELLAWASSINGLKANGAVEARGAAAPPGHGQA
jgi:glycosyltransferase involved in cell wall biosynthesis